MKFNSKRDTWILIAFITVFVPLFLLIFQPFGVNNFDPNHTIGSTFLFSMLGFGLVIGVSLTFFEFVIANKLFKNKTLPIVILKWSLELIFLTFFIFLYYNILGDFHDWYFGSFMDFVFNISIMAIIPLLIFYLYHRGKQSEIAFKELEMQPKIDLEDSFITFSSYNQKDQITMPLKNFMYAEAQDNYVSISFIEKGNLIKKLLRTKLSNLELEFKNQGIVRCHRSYLVNISNVEKLSKSGKKMQLMLQMVASPIPVSRSYFSEMEAHFSIRHK